LAKGFFSLFSLALQKRYLPQGENVNVSRANSSEALTL